METYLNYSHATVLLSVFKCSIYHVDALEYQLYPYRSTASNYSSSVTCDETVYECLQVIVNYKQAGIKVYIAGCKCM